MLTSQEEEFIIYWEKNRLKEKSLLKQFFPGIPIGLAIGAAILLMLDMDWYQRANMVADTQTSPAVIFTGIAAIVAFTGFFFKKFRWEQNEQQYRELLLKRSRESKAAESS